MESNLVGWSEAWHLENYVNESMQLDMWIFMFLINANQRSSYANEALKMQADKITQPVVSLDSLFSLP